MHLLTSCAHNPEAACRRERSSLSVPHGPRSSRTEQNRWENLKTSVALSELHPIGSDAGVDVGPNLQRRANIPAGLQTQQLKCHRGQSDSYRLVRKKSRRSLLDSGTWSDPVLERRSCSSSLTRPTSPPPVQNRRTGTDSDLYSRLPLMEI